MNFSDIGRAFFQVGFKKLLRLIRDFNWTFEKQFYRESHHSKISFVLPRLHYILRGQVLKLKPAKEFDPVEYADLTPRTVAKNKWPFFHYLIHVSGHNPKTKWDYDYLRMVPACRSYDRSLLLHARLHNRNYEKEEFRSFLSSTRKSENETWFVKKDLYVTHYTPKINQTKNAISIDIIINSCRPFLFIPSSLAKVSDGIQVSTSRVKHLDHTAEPTEDISIEIYESRLVIYSHRFIILDLDHIILTYQNFSDDTEKEFKITEMLNSINSRKSLPTSIQGKMESGFTFSISEIISEIEHQIYSDPVSLVSRTRDKHVCSRILLISHEDSHTGAPIYLNQLSQALGQNGFDVHILSLRPEFGSGSFSNLGKRHTYLADYKDRRDSKRDILHNWILTAAGVRAFSKVVKTHKPDLILANTLSSSDAIRMAVLHDVPSILYVHESWKYDPSDLKVKGTFQLRVKESMEAANLIVFGSIATYQHWQNPKFSFNGVVIPTYRRIKIPTDEKSALLRKKVRNNLEIPDDAKVFLSVATFEPRKRIQDIVISFNALNESNTYLILVGANRSLNDGDVIKLINGNHRIKLIKSTNDLYPYYASADCFVFASEEETMPMVLQESALFKLPRIISTYPGFQELTPSEEFAYLFPVGDVELLKFKMKDFLSSPELASKKALRALELQYAFNSETDLRIFSAINALFEHNFSLFPSDWSNEKS